MSASPATTTGVTLPPALALRVELEDFYAREADLLDNREYEEWLDLLTEDVTYRVPITQNVHSSGTEREFFTEDLDVSWMDEGKETLTQRVEQFRTGIHWAEEPVSRTSHLYTNLRVLEVDDVDEPHRLVVKLGFLMYRNRLRGTEDCLVGKRVDTLVGQRYRWQIATRAVHLDHSVLLANNLTTFL
ncbi:3-phenylpropionate/cinnamic acid dioxygenase subunit beta [Segeticoccus rhizosphaerae]|uniref:3-phenylpropionate/cinnamic acid dioxygenase subunit beta n=1 Tax=Segeticoccus rhizosphaerae TaxID=1104777 RepID=UPI0010C124FD|nr:3-phenylpropionate/cinnamic acid dioxygenase subunit beta [Ornithinicoccus soli]